MRNNVFNVECRITDKNTGIVSNEGTYPFIVECSNINRGLIRAQRRVERQAQCVMREAWKKSVAEKYNLDIYTINDMVADGLLTIPEIWDIEVKASVCEMTTIA